MRSEARPAGAWRTRASLAAVLVIGCALISGLVEAMALLRARRMR